ncbi:MAG: amino acid adenylation domain-containing protein [Bacteroidales bacterium]|nr:amino acid adenylation domain-containing protein [Candidatus Cacconaster merdequi]
MNDFPVSLTQLGIYLSETSASGNSDYNIDLVYNLGRNADCQRLEKALYSVLDNHRYICSRLVQTDDGQLRLKPGRVEDVLDGGVVRRYLSLEELKVRMQSRFNLLDENLVRFGICTDNGDTWFGVCFHHIVFDGISFSNFRKELSEAYDGKSLSPEEMDGFEIATDEETRRGGAEYEEAREWYANEFAPAAETDSLPIPDLKDDDSETGGRLWAKDTFDLGLRHAEISDFCKKHEVGTSAPFTLAFGYTLACYSGESQALFATIHHGRNDSRTRRSFGMMVKTFPVFQDFSRTSDTGWQLKSTFKQLKEARTRTIYSFGECCSDLSLNPQVCFAFQGPLYDYDIFLGGNRIKATDLRTFRPGYEILANVYLSPEGGYKCTTQYAADRYSKEFIRQLTTTYRNVLSGMLFKDDLSQTDLLDGEQTSLLDSFNPEIHRADPDATILSLFRQAAAEHPDNLAVTFREHSLTYRELDRLSDRIAAAIESEVVAIMVNRSEMFPAYTLAAMKAGATYQPLDPSYPAERLEYMLRDSGAGLLIADRDLRPLVSGYEGNVLFTDETGNLPQSVKELRGCTGDDIFILLYTSGSTGKPKGVRISQHNIVTFCDWYRRYYSLDSNGVVLAYASFGFDADMMDLYAALTTGAGVCIVPEETRLDLEALSDYMAANKVTHSFMTTQVGYQFAVSFASHPTLKHLTIGGEKMPSISAVPESYRLYNAYGPTECTVFTTTFPVTHYEKDIPIGRPLDTISCIIVDKNGRRVPVGACGELVVLGDQISKGYLNLPEKTAEVFGRFGRDSYCSGDIVRYRTDGNIEFVGRRDGQVKIRGFRIELKEVEAVIREFEGIKDATVQAFDLESGGKFIAAYVVSEAAVDISALNRFILERKPSYMVPAVTMQIDAIPLNVNQKVDRRKLPVPKAEETSSADAGPDREPNYLEKRILDLTAKLTGNPVEGITRPLSAQGLSSILSMRLSVQLFKQFGVRISGSSILDGASVADIENIILEETFGGDAATSRKDSPKSEEERKESLRYGSAKLSFPQQGVYVDCIANPDSTLYNIPMEIRFPSSVSCEKLRDAVEKVILAHPELSARFVDDGKDDIIQTIPENVPAASIDIRNADVEEEKKTFVRPFNLASDTLWRAVIIKSRDASQGPVLLMDIHHLVCDGSSYDIMLQEMIQEIEGVSIKEEGYTYLDYCRDQELFASSVAFKEYKAFFADELKEFETVTEISSDISGAAPGKQAEVAVRIPEECLVTDIEGITAADLWLAASGYAIGRYASTKDIYISTVSSGRGNLDIASTVGMFVNTLPVSMHIRNQSVSEYLKEVSATFRSTIARENYPFSLIAADYGYSAAITYAYQMDVLSEYKVNGESVAAGSFGLDAPKFKIGVLVELHDGVPSVVLQYDDSLYSRFLMQSLGESIVTVARTMKASPDSPINKTSMLSEERKAVLEKFHRTSDADFQVHTFHEGIERWARLTPEATAVTACDRTLTYKEFNDAAGRMANALIKEGLHRSDKVVLLLPRRSDFLVAALAVMKCGAAYIPMDPEYPVERISYILGDSEGRFVITTADKTSDYPGRAIDIEDLVRKSAECSESVTGVEVSEDDLAYLIYTSGSTGTPKGVMIQHRGISNYLSPHPDNPHTYAVATASKGVVCSATVSFDLSILEYGTALFNGKTLVLADEQATTDSLRLAALYRETGADVLSGTPSRIETYMEIPEYREIVASCRIVQMGGEKLPSSLVRRLKEITDADIFNMYGPTEITICCNASRVNDSEEITVGRPLPGFSEFIIDCDGNELPAGVTGELLISGPSLSPGYHNLPEKTAASFIEWNGLRAYKSGDLARWDENGAVLILGRTDSQVKLNGLRIELGEIESVMSRQNGVRQCVVVIRKVSGQDKLVAYYTESTPTDIASIKAGMQEKLTPYMVPSIFIKLDTMPVTPAGKIDTRHLPEPKAAASEYIEPRNDVERFFCDAVARTLNLERVGITDNFFEIGGTSLMAMRLSVAISHGGYQIAYKDIFNFPTPGEMASFASGGESIGKQSEEEEDREITGYDYSLIEKTIRANNVTTYLNDTSKRPLGRVFLTGATGYLGIHILYELLKDKDVPAIYCLVRGGKGKSPEIRLQTLLFYYFDDSYAQEFGKRLFVVDGDVTKPFDYFNEKIDTLINCAANVKHFSAGTDIEDINIGGVANCIDLCLRSGALFVQTSTGSIGGISFKEDGVTAPHILREDEFYFGQQLENKYSRSKFIAERSILEAIALKGLKAKIMRLGNLAPRSRDGEFQINSYSNSYMGRLKAFRTLGVAPYDALVSQTELSPIDDTARAICLLAGTNDRCVVFHVSNSHRSLVADVINCMNKAGLTIKPVDNGRFERELKKALEDPEKADILQSLLAYSGRSDGRSAIFNTYTSIYTTVVLMHLGFQWNTTTWDYMEQFLLKIQSLGFFGNEIKR